MSEKKPYDGPVNPKIGNAFGNDAFRKGSILLNIEAEGFDAIMKNLQIGSALLLRFNKTTVKGNPHYFVELLPPKGDSKPASKAGASSLD